MGIEQITIEDMLNVPTPYRNDTGGYYDGPNVVKRRIENPDRAKQVFSYEEMYWGNISPTDGDLILDFKNKVWVFVEFKHISNRYAPKGQLITLERLVENLSRLNIHAIAIVANHCSSPDEIPLAANCPVSEAYYSEIVNYGWSDDKWRNFSDRKPLKKFIDDYLDFCMGEYFRESIEKGIYRDSDWN